MSTDGFVTAEAVEQTVTKIDVTERSKTLRERVIISDESKGKGNTGGGRLLVWRRKWDPLVAESGEGGGWEEEVGGVMVVEEME
ncbi:hypothetical protein Tco_0644880 [Tanacetum coccineum]